MVQLARSSRPCDDVPGLVPEPVVQVGVGDGVPPHVIPHMARLARLRLHAAPDARHLLHTVRKPLVVSVFHMPREQPHRGVELEHRVRLRSVTERGAQLHVVQPPPHPQSPIHQLRRRAAVRAVRLRVRAHVHRHLVALHLVRARRIVQERVLPVGDVGPKLFKGLLLAQHALEVEDVVDGRLIRQLRGGAWNGAHVRRPVPVQPRSELRNDDPEAEHLHAPRMHRAHPFRHACAIALNCCGSRLGNR